ncbi:MAG: hypothetical protein EOO89_07335 [Pedobacter sp.]|nr:MAG: hypothetical protein EOO89_07335 [Pedobacter sp.]
MKNIILLCFLILGLQACQNEADYKSVRKEVLDAHDNVMMDGEIAIKNKMRLDTISANMDSLSDAKLIADTIAEKQTIDKLKLKLNKADDMMNDWMHKFNAELDGKSNAEAVSYFKAEKVKVNTLDSLYKEAIGESAAYLSKFKK